MARKSSEMPVNTKTSFRAFSTLRTIALITTSLLILNKVPSLYALASVITKGSAPETPLQMSMHTYSLVALVLAACLLPIIRRPASAHTAHSRPMALVLLAHLHVLDFVLGVFFTLLFAGTWFRMITHPDPSQAGPGAAGMDAAAGFTNPETPVESVVVGAEPAEGKLNSDQNTTLVGVGGENFAGNATAIGDAGQFGPEGAASMVLMSVLWTIRAYLLACVIIYVRGAVRDANARGADVMEKHGWLDPPGRWLCKIEQRFWLGSGYQLLKRNRRDSGPSPRDSSDSDKEFRQQRR